MKAIRDAYADALVELGKEHDFLVFDADLAGATKTAVFKKAFPERFYDMGIAEANMFGYAAGVAASGTPVFASTFSAFAAGRAFDQIRNSIAYPNNHVIIGATHNGVLIGADGGSHQCLEDIALMRSIPGMTVICPCDEEEMRAYTKAALTDVTGPVYLRIGRSEVPNIFGKDEHFEIGKGNVICDGSDAVIFTVGEVGWRALEAAKKLQAEGISVAVVSLASIKPIDEELIISYAKKTKRVFTAEDHNIYGGLGSAVCEVLCTKCPTKVTMIGIKDEFGVSGSTEELAKIYGIDADSIAETVRSELKK